MKDIKQIFSNQLGITFKWEIEGVNTSNRIQVVFRDTGLYLTNKELEIFAKNIDVIYTKLNACSACVQNKCNKTLLLNSPCPKISFALNYKELTEIKELIDVTNNYLKLERFLKANNIYCSD